MALLTRSGIVNKFRLDHLNIKFSQRGVTKKLEGGVLHED